MAWQESSLLRGSVRNSKIIIIKKNIKPQHRTISQSSGGREGEEDEYPIYSSCYCDIEVLMGKMEGSEINLWGFAEDITHSQF